MISLRVRPTASQVPSSDSTSLINKEPISRAYYALLFLFSHSDPHVLPSNDSRPCTKIASPFHSSLQRLTLHLHRHLAGCHPRLHPLSHLLKQNLNRRARVSDRPYRLGSATPLRLRRYHRGGSPYSYRHDRENLGRHRHPPRLATEI